MRRKNPYKVQLDKFQMVKDTVQCSGGMVVKVLSICLHLDLNSLNIS